MKKYIALIIITVILVPTSILLNLFASENSFSEFQPMLKDGSIIESSSDEIFPEAANLTYITEIDFVETPDHHVGGLASLSASDDDLLSIEGHWRDGMYRYDTRFYYGADEFSSHIEKYDLYLFLEVEASIYPQELYFQYYTYNLTPRWENLTAISNNFVKIDMQFLERATQFRIHGNLLSDRSVEIDVLNLILLHRGAELGYYNYKDIQNSDSDVDVAYRDVYSGGIPGDPLTEELFNGVNPEWDSTPIWTDNWWEASGGGSIYSHSFGSRPGEYRQFGFRGDLNYYMWFEHEGYVYDWGELFQYDVNVKKCATTKLTDANPGDFIEAINSQFWVTPYNFQTGKGDKWSQLGQGHGWSNISHCSGENTFDFDSGWNYISASEVPDYFQYHSGSQRHRFRVLTSWEANPLTAWWYGGTLSGWGYEEWLDDITQISSQYLNVEVKGAGFDNLHDYPQISIFSVPDSPIYPLESFDIKSNIISPQGNPIISAECYLRNETWGSGWQDMTFRDGSWNKTFYAYDLEQGNYTVWMKTVDDQGLESLESEQITIYNAVPDIEIQAPVHLQSIDKLYDFEAAITVSDEESNPIEDVEFRIVSMETDEVTLDWTDMDDEGSLSYSYTFDPIEHHSGWNELEFRAKDAIDWGYNSVQVNFLRYDPAIEFTKEKYTISGVGQTTVQFTVIEGFDSIKNMTYSVQKSIGGASFTYGSIEKKSAAVYNFSINSVDLPNGDLLCLVKIMDLDDNEATFITDLSVNYFLETGYQFEYVFDYDNSSVTANKFSSADVYIDYADPLGYNYAFELPTYIKNYVYTSSPNYEIYHVEADKKYSPSSSSFSSINFEFSEKPSSHRDLLHFRVKAPELGSSEEFPEWEKGTLSNGGRYASYEFILSSGLYFQDVRCELSPYMPLRDANTYEWKVFKLQAEDWVETDLSINVTGDYFSLKFIFKIEEIRPDEVLTLRLYGVGLSVVSADLSPFLFTGVVAIVSGVLFAALRKKLLKDVKFFKKKPWVFYVIAVIAVAGASVGTFFISSGTTTAFIIKGMVIS